MRVLLLLLFITLVWGKPARKHNPMINEGLFEGDIMGRDPNQDRNAIPLDSQRWPGGVIPYVIDESLYDIWDLLMKSMKHIEQGTCIRFKERTNERDYVKMYKGDGCWSLWGRLGEGEQKLSLGDGCEYFGTVVHEFLHAIGFEHEHNRSDRDDYLDIYWENIEQRGYPRSPMENPDLFQGDILGIENLDRNALKNDSKRWPDGVIPYKIDKGLDNLKEEIEKVMKFVMDKTCLKFVPRQTETDYIRIFYGDGCYSHWGRTGRVQPLSLGSGCESFGTIIHELTHAIGFDHEQNRSDRDDYLIIYYQNIDPESLNQFDKLKPFQNRLINAFDYDSIMLYGEKTFSRDGRSKTMKAKKKGITLLDLDKKNMPSDSDMYRINVLYECKGYV